MNLCSWCPGQSNVLVTHDQTRTVLARVCVGRVGGSESRY